MNILLLVWPIETFPQPSQRSIFDLYFLLFLIIHRLPFHPYEFARLLDFELFFIIFILLVLQSHPSLFESTLIFLYQTTVDSLTQFHCFYYILGVKIQVVILDWQLFVSAQLILGISLLPSEQQLLFVIIHGGTMHTALTVEITNLRIEGHQVWVKQRCSFQKVVFSSMHLLCSFILGLPFSYFVFQSLEHLNRIIVILKLHENLALCPQNGIESQIVYLLAHVIENQFFKLLHNLLICNQTSISGSPAVRILNNGHDKDH